MTTSEREPAASAPPRAYQRNEVFVVGGQPTVTYNPRPGQGVEQRVRDYLEERNRILCITGPSKSGKTVLVREVVDSAIRLSGGDLTTVEDFWAEIVDCLGEFTDEAGERTMLESSTSSAEGGAQVKPFGVGLEGKRGAASESATHQTRSKARSRSPRNVAKGALRQTRRPVVIDDFHHIGLDVQQGIVRGVKDLVFEGLAVILVAVPHRAADVVRAEPEMKKRVEHLQITPWSQLELEEIASRGFHALNIDCPEPLSEALARESYGSPHLMQDFCRQICKANNVKETLADRISLRWRGQLKSFFHRIASREGEDEAYRRLAQGPRQRTDRKRRRLRTGENTDLYGAVLSAIAKTGPLIEIDWTEIRRRLREVMEDDPPRKGEYTRALEQMSKIARELVIEKETGRYLGDPALEYDSELGKVHITDPFFAFHLRWSVRQWESG
jgi:hypothetical protein